MNRETKKQEQIMLEQLAIGRPGKECFGTTSKPQSSSTCYNPGTCTGANEANT